MILTRSYFQNRDMMTLVNILARIVSYAARGRELKPPEIKQTARTLIALSAIFLLQSGCATVQISQKPNNAAPVVKQLVKTTQSWNGAFLPAYPKGQPEVTMLRISIPAGTRLHTHLHPVINAGLMISGQLTVVTKDGKTLHLQAGDSIVELVDTLHYGMNPGKVPAEIVVFYAGVVDKPITVAESH
jgi:quercetin dioxygenase-like cupin family protein